MEERVDTIKHLHAFLNVNINDELKIKIQPRFMDIFKPLLEIKEIKILF